MFQIQDVSPLTAVLPEKSFWESIANASPALALMGLFVVLFFVSWFYLRRQELTQESKRDEAQDVKDEKRADRDQAREKTFMDLLTKHNETISTIVDKFTVSIATLSTSLKDNTDSSRRDHERILSKLDEIHRKT